MWRGILQTRPSRSPWSRCLWKPPWCCDSYNNAGTSWQEETIRCNIYDPFRVSGCTKHSLQNKSKWASVRAHLSGLVKITVTAQLKGFECTVQCLLVSLAETHQKREHALPLWAPDESDVFSLMNPGELFTQRRQLSLHDSLKVGKVEWGTYKRAAGGGRARVEQRAGLSEGHQPHIVELDRVQQLY